MVVDSDKERYEKLFAELDKNKDGSIGVEELKSGLKHRYGKELKKHAEEFITKSDKDSDKKLSLQEFVEVLKENERQLKLTFVNLDKNKDGQIDPSEIQAAFEEMDLSISLAEAERLSKKIDKNGNLALDWAEWRNFFQFATKTSFEDMTVFWRQTLMIDIGENMTVPPEFTKKEKVSGQWWRLLVSGGVAGFVSRTCTAPLDRVKIFYQVHGSKVAKRGVLEVVKQMLKEGGLRSLWRGNGANIIKIAPETALKFYAYETLKKLRKGDGVERELLIYERLLAGSCAGAFAQSCIYPLEVLKTRMVLGKSGQYKGMVDCMAKIVKKEGVKGLYRGYQPNMIGIIPYAGIDLAAFETLKSIYKERNPEQEAPGIFALLAFGTCSSTLGQLCTYPLALIRTKMQAGEGKEILSVAKDIVEKDGFKGLYRGLAPNFMKVLPAVSISYAVYEKTKAFLIN